MPTEEKDKIQPDPNHDFNAPIERTSVEIAKFILSKVDEAKDFMIVENYEKLEPIKKAAFGEKSMDVSIEITKYMAATDIPADYATRSIDKIIVVLETLKAFIGGGIGQNKDELMSRYMGVRSPKTGKYASDCATLGDLLLKLDTIRKEQGDNKYDYFNEPVMPVEATSDAEVPATPEPGTAIPSGDTSGGSELSTPNVASPEATA